MSDGQAIFLEREGSGRYMAFIEGPYGRQRCGLVLGKSGHWVAETTHGRVLGHRATREAAALLLSEERSRCP